MTISERVKKLRKKMEISQSELADQIGDVPYQSIQNLETGKVTRPRYLAKLANVLGCTVDFLLTGNEDQQEIDLNKLQACIAAVNSVMEDEQIVLNNDQQAKLVAYLYSEVLVESEISNAKVLKLAGFFT